MRRWRSDGLVFTEFLDPAGERWVEVLREEQQHPLVPPAA